MGQVPEHLLNICPCKLYVFLILKLKLGLIVEAGTGIFQPADVGLNHIIKHRLRQRQLQYLVDCHTKQIALGLTADQVKFSTSLPVLRDASVANIVEVQKFLNGPDGCDLIRKASSRLLSFFLWIHAYDEVRHGKEAVSRNGTFRNRR